MDLEGLRSAYADSGLNEELYDLIRRTVRQIIVTRRYPPAYAPYGRWDEETYDDLAHEWTLRRLLRGGQLEHLLLTNETVRGFQHGLELSFIGFLLNQRQRSALDNLYDRAGAVLEGDARFQQVGSAARTSHRLWGLAGWHGIEVLGEGDAQLIAAGLEIECPPVIRYRVGARKLSPIISDANLATYLHALLTRVNALLRLSQIMTVFRYRFDLLHTPPLSLDEPRRSAEGDNQPDFELTDQTANVEEQVLIGEAVESVLRELSVRQQQALYAYARHDATLTAVAAQLGCAKSTVENEVRRALTIIGQYSDGSGEAARVYDRVLEQLAETSQN